MAQLEFSQQRADDATACAAGASFRAICVAPDEDKYSVTDPKFNECE